jgi:hypothetical protein
VVIISLMGPAAAVVYALTAKMGTIGMQMSWQAPDAALVGLAQLRGEGRADRGARGGGLPDPPAAGGLRGVACAMLALNPRSWRCGWARSASAGWR